MTEYKNYRYIDDYNHRIESLITSLQSTISSQKKPFVIYEQDNKLYPSIYSFRI